LPPSGRRRGTVYLSKMQACGRHFLSVSVDDILDFWFKEATGDRAYLDRMNRVWFGSDADTDRAIAERFGDTVAAAGAGTLESWGATARGRLALILLLDQFPRNMHRGTARAYGHDARALACAREGIALGQDKELSPIERMFFYMPLQHAESEEAQELSVQCCEALVAEVPETLRGYFQNAADYARQHRDIVRRFGRFPHRNRVLGRNSTGEEMAYLADGAPTYGQK